MNQGLVQRVSLARQNLNRLAAAQPLASPYREINVTRRLLNEKALRLQHEGFQKTQQAKDQLSTATALLEANNPLGILSRGYSVTTNATTNESINSWRQAPSGTTITTRLAEGELYSRVERSVESRHRDEGEIFEDTQ